MFVEGFWAPTNVSWGTDNRTSTARVLSSSEKSTRVELRVVGSDVNPYLAMAAALVSGLYGIKKGLSLESKTSKNTTSLASNLRDASTCMKNSQLAHELLGSQFVEHFIQTREWEWREHMKAVTDWEFKRYFEII